MLRKILRDISDGMNPLVVLEFRRLRRSGALPTALVVYLAGLGVLLCLLPTWEDPLYLVLLFAVVSVFTGVSGLCEGKVSVDQPVVFDEILELNGLSDLEKMHGRLQIGLFLSLLFGLSAVPFLLVGVFFNADCLYVLLAPVVSILLPLSFKPLLFSLVPPGRKASEKPICVSTILLLGGAVFFTVFLVEHLNSRLGEMSDWTVPAFLVLLGCVLLVYPVLCYRLARYHVSPPRKLIFRIAWVNMVFHLAVLGFLGVGWFVLRCLF